MTEELRGRALIESLYGPVGKGVREMMIGDGEYDIPTLLARMDMAWDDMRAIDMLALEADRYVLRYYDTVDQSIVAHEFNGNFEFLIEHRAHVSQWIGEDAYFDSFRGVDFRCPLVPGDDF
jgi:hypothetical protein